MIIKKTKIDGVYIIEPELKKDNRGYFTRIFCQKELKDIRFNVVQINRSMTLKKGTIRGPHMQKYPRGEEKLVQCIRGSIFDVAIDVRKNSKTYGQWVGNVLSLQNNKMSYIPKEIIHGFQALEDNTIVQYPVSEYYYPESVIGIRWNDPYFNIKWPIKKVIVSDIDASWPLYK